MPTAVVAGHICLDIIPAIDTLPGDGALVVPGRLVTVGPAALATGGAVSNTGLALHRLGIPTRLMGKIGDDLFGRAILDVVRSRDPELAAGMIVDPGGPSSYTVVINPPGVDRSFLHCPGSNDTFGAADVDPARLAGADLFHFGYPPIMRRMYADGGQELAALMARVRATGLATSLDMAHVDVNSPAGKVDWRSLLAAVLPSVDFFLPNLDEAFFMLEPNASRHLAARSGHSNVAAGADMALVLDLSEQLLQLGAAVVGLKLGDQGMLLRTSADPAHIARVGRGLLDAAWVGRTLYAPAFQVRVAGTTGAGDCAIAGFHAALLRGAGPEEALLCAVAAGACNVEQTDAISGVPTWEALQARLAAPWAQLPSRLDTAGWQRQDRLWHGAQDGQVVTNT